MPATIALPHADITAESLAECDREDPLASFRDAFDLPEGVIYLDGNSLGALPRRAEQVALKVLRQDWREGLIRSWNDAGWYALPRRLGSRISSLIGAAPDEVVMTDSTSVNLFKVLGAALRLRPGRRVIVSERDNFPTDLYIAAGLAGLIDRGHALRLVDSPDQLPQAMDDGCAVLLLTHVNYRDGRMHDMAALTRLAHDRGALAVWDLAHSSGAVEVDLDGCAVDFAVGCTYKYLNGGPGAPAFVFAARRWHSQCEQPLSGWWGHAAPFGFDPSYRPEAGIGRFLCGTPPVLSMAVAEAGIDMIAEATPARIRAKSVALCETFIALVERDCAGFGLELASPRDPARRGSQVSFLHRDGYAIMRALAERGVLGDYREPGILRFGFAPLYLRHADVGAAVRTLRDVLTTAAWNDPRYLARRTVT